MHLILLATYNGAEFLPEFLDSVRRQTVSDWRMLIRDDASSDGTLEILSRAAAADSRIELLRDGKDRQGVTGNFTLLMQQAAIAGAAYVFFADQDDVWLPDKLQRQLERMRQIEAFAGPETPLLVHSDLTLVDRNLRLIHPSHSRCTRTGRDSQHEPLRTLLTNNFVTGCAALINRPLLQAALPVPAAAVLHDWWIALCAAAFGTISYIPQATVLYRQHGRNVVGAERFWTRLNPLTGRWRSHWSRTLENFRRGAAQARALHRRINERGGIPPERRELVEQYARLLESRTTALGRIRTARRLRLGRHGALNQLLLAARLCLLPGPPLAKPG